jgi:hypothetical protein
MTVRYLYRAGHIRVLHQVNVFFRKQIRFERNGKRRVFKDDYQFRTIRLSIKYLLP